jgi:hypothetical protein
MIGTDQLSFLLIPMVKFRTLWYLGAIFRPLTTSAYQAWIEMNHFRRKILKATKESAMRLSVTKTAKTCPTEIAANISPCVTGKTAQLLSRPYFPN